MPTNGGPHGRRPSNIPPSLPPTVERAYRLKCIQLKRRISDVDDCNDAYRLRKIRVNRGIMKMRLERAYLLEQLTKRMRANVDESEGSASPPPTPTERPLRTKRGHRKLSIPMSPQHLNHVYGSTDLSFPPLPAENRIDFFSSNADVSNTRRPRGHANPTATANTHHASPANQPPTRPPPRPKNAYMIFCDHARDRLRNEHVGEPDFDIHRAMAVEWRKLSDEEQRPFFEIYEARKEAWEGDMGDYRRRGEGAHAAAKAGSGQDGFSQGTGQQVVQEAREARALGAEDGGEDATDAQAEKHDDDVEMDEGAAEATVEATAEGGGFTAVNR